MSIKSCPFCGSNRIIPKAVSEEEGMFVSQCMDCGAEGPPRKGAPSALDGWNIRYVSKMQRPTQSELTIYGTMSCELPKEECTKAFDYYESCGWRAGRNPMKDWKAAVRLWASRWRADQFRKPAVKQSSPGNIHTSIKQALKDARV